MFDIGANEGNTYQFYLSHYSKIVCFEPNPQLFNHLNTKFLKNNQVIVDSRGLSNKNEDKLFKISNINTLSTFSDDWINQSRFTGAYSWNESITVKTTTLDNIIKEYGIPNFVKIDVEGYELEVF
jgi:FkbM family methyltransferase